MIRSLVEKHGFTMDTPLENTSEGFMQELLYGSPDQMEIEYSGKFSGTYTTSFEGLVNNMERRFRDTKSETMRGFIEKYMSEFPARCVRASGSTPTAWR